MFRNVCVTEIKTKTLSGYSVIALYRAPFEDMFEQITHPAVFADKERAERFCEKVKNNLPKINFSNWILPTDITAHIQAVKNPDRYLVS